MLNVADGGSTLLLSGDGIREPNWLGGMDGWDGDDELKNTVLVLKPGYEGTTEILAGDARSFEERWVIRL